jgi:hypothetical protein
MAMETMCPQCRGLGMGRLGLPAHDRLGHRGDKQPAQKGREENRESHYRCMECETHWIQEFDRWGTNIGFKLAP